MISQSNKSSVIRMSLTAVLIMLLVVVSYGLSLKNGFIWDDETLITRNPFVNDLSQWKSYFTLAETVSDDPAMSLVYRPVQTLSFALDAALWGTWAGGFHLSSILLHLAACIAVFFLFSPLIGKRPSTIAVAIFSVHPALSESVLSLASRGNQLYTLFALISIACFVRTIKPLDKFHFASILAGLAALFSKEPAISFLALLPLTQLIFNRPWPLRLHQATLLYFPYILIATTYLWARATVVAAPQMVVFWGGSLWSTILLQAKVFIAYLKLLFWPFHLQGRYSVGGVDALAAAALFSNIALVTIAVYSWRRGHRGKLLTFAIAWFYISLAPVSNLIPLPGAMMGERFIYFTFAGMIPLLIGCVDGNRWSRYLWRAAPAFLLLLVAFLYTNINRTFVWKDESSYFTVLAQQEPKDPIVQINMARVELEQGNVVSALSRLEKMRTMKFSTPFDEDRALFPFWYGKALLHSNRPEEAHFQLSLAASLSTDRPQGLVLLQVEAAARSNRLGAARVLIENELKTTPDESPLWNALGNVLLMSGDETGAFHAYTKAVEFDPQNKEAKINLQNLRSGGKN